MIQPNTEVNEPHVAQEVVYNHDIDIEVAKTNTLGDESDAIMEASVPTKPSGSSAKKLLCGMTFILLIGAAVAGGKKIANANQQQATGNIQVQKNAIGTKTGKGGKAKAGFYTCIVAPILAIDMDVDSLKCDALPEFPTRKNYFKKWWNPYVRECSDFWGTLFYVLKRFAFAEFTSFCDKIIAFLKKLDAFLGNIKFPRFDFPQSCYIDITSSSSSDEHTSVLDILAHLDDAAFSKFRDNVKTCVIDLAPTVYQYIQGIMVGMNASMKALMTAYVMGMMKGYMAMIAAAKDFMQAIMKM